MARLPVLEGTIKRLLWLPGSPAAAPERGDQRELSAGGMPRALRGQRRHEPAAQGLLTDAEIVRALRRFRFDPEFRGARRVPIRVLASLAGLSHQTVYQAMRPDPPMRPLKISGCTRAKLSGAIAAILDGRLRFRRRKQVWEIEGSILRAQCQPAADPNNYQARWLPPAENARHKP
jgi:hypothetical protein